MEEEINRYKIRLGELQANTERTALKIVEKYDDHAQESKEPCLEDETSKQTDTKVLTSQNDNEEELLLVFNELEILLEEYKYKFKDYEEFTNSQGESLLDQQLKFKAVNIILVEQEGTKLTSRTQSFAITHQIEISTLKEVSIKFWDLGKESSSFLLYIIEDDGSIRQVSDIDQNNSLIQSYLIEKKQVKRAIFILIDESISSNSLYRNVL